MSNYSEQIFQMLSLLCTALSVSAVKTTLNSEYQLQIANKIKSFTPTFQSHRYENLREVFLGTATIISGDLVLCVFPHQDRMTIIIGETYLAIPACGLVKAVRKIHSQRSTNSFSAGPLVAD